MHDSIGPYRIVASMGTGGTGNVYRGEHVEHGGPAAVKWPIDVKSRACAAIRREIAVLKRLGELDGVVRLLDSGHQAGVPWYAMEQVEGEPLAEYQRRLWETRLPGPSLHTVTRTAEFSASDALEFVDSAANASDAELMESVASASDANLSAKVLGVDERPAPTESSLPIAARGQLTRVLEIAEQIADTLHAIHAEGVVHGDLSPHNIVLRADTQRPVLVDFGNASSALDMDSQREVAEAAHPRSGTPGYMAPEQIHGAAPDARCDLYALGCMLYELLVGRRPYFAVTHRATLEQQLRTLAPAPSTRVQGISPELDRLVMGLLERDPWQRIGRASEVSFRLRAIAKKPSLFTSSKSHKLLLYRPRFAGREAALSELQRHAQAAMDGKSGFLLISGESGIGKTRLANELATRAAGFGMLTLASQCARAVSASSNLTGRPLQAFMPVIEHLASSFAAFSPGSVSSDELASELNALRPYAPDVLRGLCANEPNVALAPELARKRVIASLFQVLTRVSSQRPLLLVVDDVQWADALSLRFIREALSRVQGARLLVVCICRTPEGADVLQSLSPAALCTIELPRLESSVIQRLAKDMLGGPCLPEGLFAFLERQAEGNPFFAAEYLRIALSRGFLVTDADGSFRFDAQSVEADHDLPQSLSDLFALRTAGLSSGAARLLELACVLGRRFDAELLAKMAETSEVLESAEFAELVAQQIIEIVSATRCRFVHDGQREIQYQALSPELRRALHRAAAKHLESMQVAELQAELGFHWACAGEPVQALPYLTRAAQQAQASFAGARAAELYRLAIAQSEQLTTVAGHPEPAVDDSKLAELYEGLGDVLVAEALHTEARLAFDAAKAHVTGGRVRARICRKQAASYWMVHDYANADQQLRAALEALGPPSLERPGPDNIEYIEVQIGRFQQLYFARQVGGETETLLRALRPYVDAHGSPAQRCLYYLSAASHEKAFHRYAFSLEAVELCNQALAIEPSTLPLNLVALARFMAGFTRMTAEAKSRLNQAFEHLKHAENDAKRAADTTLLSRIRAYQILTLVRMGDANSVSQAALSALHSAEVAQLPPYTAAALAGQAWVAWRGDDSVSARSLAERAKSTWKAHPHAFPFEWLASFPLLDIYAGEENFAAARGVLDDLLSEHQQALPRSLVESIEQARRTPSDDEQRFQRELRAVMVEARRLAFC